MRPDALIKTALAVLVLMWLFYDAASCNRESQWRSRSECLEFYKNTEDPQKLCN